MTEQERTALIDAIWVKLQAVLTEMEIPLVNNTRLAMNEAWRVLQLAITELVQIIQDVCKDLEGKGKKELAMQVVGLFYDRVLVVVAIPFVPAFLQPIFSKYARTIFMAMASGAIDAIVTTMWRLNVFTAVPQPFAKN